MNVQGPDFSDFRDPNQGHPKTP